MLVEAAHVDPARVDRGGREHGVAGGEAPDAGARRGIEREHVAVVRAEVEPASGHGHVGAEAVVARLRVVERQALDGLLDHPHAPPLFAVAASSL